MFAEHSRDIHNCCYGMVDHSNRLHMAVDMDADADVDLDGDVDTVVGTAVDRNPSMADRCMIAMNMDLKFIQNCCVNYRQNCKFEL